MAEFFSMGGYGAYVWPCYLLSVLVIGALMWTRLKSIAAARRDGRAQGNDRDQSKHGDQGSEAS